VASAVWLDCDERRIDLLKQFGIGCLQHTTLLRSIVFVENPETQSLLPVRLAHAPCLGRARILDRCLLIQIVGVENERLSLGRMTRPKAFRVWPFRSTS